MRIKPFHPITRPIKIALVGEAPGEEEERLGEPFVGSSGRELSRMLRDAGILRQDCFITNVFLDRPEGNELERFCLDAKSVKAEYMCSRDWLRTSYPNESWPTAYDYPPVSKGQYVHPRKLPELLRLREELAAIRPNLVVALGNTACWALLGTSGISKLRGTAQHSTLLPGLKVIPTYHPAAVMRAWDLRVIVVADLMKAAREQEFPEIVRPEREVWIEPSFEDMLEFERRYMQDDKLESIDIETEKGQITCIGFAPTKQLAICVPFWDKRRPDWSYWNSREEETAAWGWVKKHCTRAVPKLFQNGLYDLQYLWRVHGIPVANCEHDTMLMHHSLYPELEKGLGFLGSIYTNEASWKVMRPRGKKEIKADA